MRYLYLENMENDYEIKYTNIRNGYARINREGKLVFSIPNFLRNDKKFHDGLILKWQKLLEKYGKKNHIDKVLDDQILIFWEYIDKSDLWKNKKEVDLEIKKILLEYSKPILDEVSDVIWYKYSDLKIKKLRSKRGSCDHNQNIVLNQELIHYPSKFTKYVVIHEAAHLKHKHHQKPFRDLVEKLYPNYKIIRKELKNIIIR